MGRTFNVNAQNPVWSIKRTQPAGGNRFIYVDGGAGVDQERNPADPRAEWGASAASPYASIQYALDHAANIEGDVYVMIARGNYAEELSISSRLAGRLFLIGQPGAAAVHDSTAAGVNTRNAGGGGAIDAVTEVSGLHRVIFMGAHGMVAAGVTAGDFIGIKVTAGAFYEWMTILEIDTATSIVVGGDAAVGSVYPLIATVGAVPGDYDDQPWAVYRPGVVVIPANQNPLPTTPLYVTGSPQSDPILTGDESDITIGAVWIKFDASNGTAGGSAITLEQANMAADLCQFECPGGGISTGINIVDSSRFISGAFFNGAIGGQAVGLRLYYGVPTAVQTATQAGAIVTLWANPAAGVDMTSRKGIGDVSAAGAVGGACRITNDSHVVMDGVEFAQVAANDLSVAVSFGSSWLGYFGVICGQVSAVACNGSIIGRGRIEDLVVTNESHVVVPYALHVDHDSAVALDAVTVSLASSLEANGNLRIDNASITASLVIIDGSDAYVGGTCIIAQTAAAANGDVYISENSSFTHDSAFAIASISAANCVQVVGGSRWNGHSDIGITRTAAGGGVSLYVAQASVLTGGNDLNVTSSKTGNSVHASTQGVINIAADVLLIETGAGGSSLVADTQAKIFIGSTFGHGGAGTSKTGNLVDASGQAFIEIVGAVTVLDTGGGANGVIWVQNGATVRFHSTSTITTNKTGTIVLAMEGGTIDLMGHVTLVDTGAGNASLIHSREHSVVCLGDHFEVTATPKTGNLIYVHDNATIMIEEDTTITDSGAGANSIIRVTDSGTLNIGVVNIVDTKKTDHLIDILDSSTALFTGTVTISDSSAGNAASILYVANGSSAVFFGAFDVNATTKTNPLFYLLNQARVVFESTFEVTDGAAGGATGILYVASSSNLLIKGTYTVLSSAKTGNSITATGLSRIEFGGLATITETGASGAYVVYADNRSEILFQGTAASLTIAGTTKQHTIIVATDQSKIQAIGTVAITDTGADAQVTGLVLAQGESDILITGTFTASSVNKTLSMVMAQNGGRILFGAAVAITATAATTGTITAIANSEIHCAAGLTLTTALSTQAISISRMSRFQVDGTLNLANAAAAGAHGSLLKVLSGSIAHLGLVQFAGGNDLAMGAFATIQVVDGSQLHVTDQASDALNSTNPGGASVTGILLDEGSLAFCPPWGANTGIASTLGAANGRDMQVGSAAAAEYAGSERVADAARLCYMSKP